ncbi:MAG TPA: lipopolysaccharide biosynthesis protein, partial [Actinoplanes sp.]|nr:lipopolysaccharide biosynthesis protein [Actinoplanes sp.]
MTAIHAAPQQTGPGSTGKRGIFSALKGHVDLFLNAGSLMATTLITSAFGFAFWWVAARLAPQAAVGEASAAVSAMTLIGTIGMFGMGTMLIAELPTVARGKWDLISTCLLTAGTAATAGGLLYVLSAHLWIPSLQDALGGALGTVLLVIGIALTAITLVLDEAMVGLLQGPLQLMRNAWFSLIKLVLLGVVAVIPGLAMTGSLILLTWVAGIVTSTAILFRVLRRRGMIDSLRPRPALMRGRGRATFDHNLLNLATYLPRVTLPLIVLATISKEANAAFYTAFMVLSFMAMVPGNFAITLFAVTAGDKSALRSKVRVGLAICLGAGLPASLVVYFLSEQIMGLFGSNYAKTAGEALAILTLTYVPFVFHHFFLAISRVQGKLRGAGVFAVFAGLAELGAAWWGGTTGNLNTLVTAVAVVMAIETVLIAPIVLKVVFAPVVDSSAAAAEGVTVMSTTSLTLRERAWLPLEYIRTVGPLAGVDANRVRNALIGLHAADPTHRAVSRLDRSGATWQHMDAASFRAYVQEAVTDIGYGPIDFDAVTRHLQAEPRGHHPVRILVGGGYFALKVSHAYGDAGPVNTLVHELVQAAAEGRAARIAPSKRHKLALPVAWWKQFGLKPGRWKEGLSFARPPHVEQTRSRPWQDDLTVVTGRSGHVLGQMRSWRDQHAPGVTTSAITFAAFTAALIELGLKPDLRGGTFLADARRYLGKGVSIDSNFCQGPFLTPPSLTDPVAIHRTLKAELATGRILTMMLLREGKIMLTGTPGMPDPYPTEVAVEPQPRLTFSNQGRHDMLGDLPWAVPPGGRVNQSVPTLNGPEGITLTTS